MPSLKPILLGESGNENNLKEMMLDLEKKVHSECVTPF